jgi:hypothetical protein
MPAVVPAQRGLRVMAFLRGARAQPALPVRHAQATGFALPPAIA